MSRSPETPQSTSLSAIAPAAAVLEVEDALRRGNREVIADHYFHIGAVDEPERYRNKVFVRLGARKETVFRKVSFTHCVFDGCYLANCVFDSCDFTGCRFLGTNFHQSTFRGCKFWYATFERTEIDDDILISEAPAEENLRMRFARALRMNFSQLGDAKAVNRAISIELEATERYLRRSWSPNRTSYYQTKYPGWNQAWQFFRWADFKVLDIVWGNGESIFKLVRSIFLAVGVVAIYDIVTGGNSSSFAAWWASLTQAPAVFIGVLPKNYPPLALALIAGSRYVSLALLTALLVKRFGRR